MGDKRKLMRPRAPRVRDKCGRQGGDKCKLMRPKEPRVGDKCKLMRPKAPRVGDKGETSVNSCGPRNPEWETRGRQVWETSVGDKCGDKWATSVNSCGPRHPSRRQGGDKCKLMRPKEPRVGDKCARQVWETSGRHV